jgi:hypothetical protein
MLTATVTELDLAQTLAGLRGDWQPVDQSARIQVREPRIIVASDLHVPYHDEGLIASMLERADLLKTDAIVWLGDLLDNPTFSSWGNEDLSTTFDRELGIAEGIIRLASRFVSRQYWSMGNHEMRWMRKLGYQTNMTHLAKIAGLGDLLADGRLIVSDNPTLDYRHDWMLTHPKQYGPTPLVVPGKLAERFARNVVSAHAHHWGMGLSESGRFVVIEAGGLFEPKYVKYVQQQVTANRAWAKGYVVLNHGEPTLVRG